MKKAFLVLTILLLTFGILISIPAILAENGNEGQGADNSDNISAGQDNSGDNGSETNEEKICCHIFGYGANMEKVSSQYKLMERGECIVAEDFVGGGREIVARIRCEQGYTERVQAAVQERNRLRLNASEVPENCNKEGSVITCELKEGKTMAVMAGESGNTIIKIDGENISTKAQLYHNNGEIYGAFGNETKSIEYLPEQLREKIRERIRARINNTKINLNENGEYEYEAEKEARFLGLFKVKERMKWNIDPETGEILRERGPWWGFLAADVKEA